MQLPLEPTKQQKKWYREEWLFVLMVLVPPVGIIRMWLVTDWQKKTKLLVTIGLVIWFFVFAGIAAYAYNISRPYSKEGQIINVDEKIIDGGDKTRLRIDPATGEAIYIPIPKEELAAAETYLTKKYGQSFSVVDRSNHYPQQGPPGTVAWYKMNVSTLAGKEPLWFGLEQNTGANKSARPYDENFLDLYWGKQETSTTNDFLLTVYPTVPLNRVEIKPSDSLYVQIKGKVPSLDEMKKTHLNDISYKIFIDLYLQSDPTESDRAEIGTKIYQIAKYALFKYPADPTIDLIVHTMGKSKQSYYQCIVAGPMAAKLKSSTELTECLVRHDGSIDRF